MGKGRKQIPDNMKVVKGTFRNSRSNPDKPESDAAGLLAPAWLPAECLEHFRTVKDRISVYNLDSASWTEAAALIALRLHEIETCNEIIAQEGRTYRSETASEKPIINGEGKPVFPVKVMIKGHPAVSQRNEAMRHLQSLLAEFGLTPAAISKVSTNGGGKKEKDPWENFGSG